jgi:hypothetical protein
MSHEEFIRCQREMYYDRKHDANLQAVAEAAAATGGMGMGGLGADMGAEDLGAEMPSPEEAGGPVEMAAGEAGAPPAGEPGAEPAGDESALLAVPPGSRDVRTYKGGAKPDQEKRVAQPAGTPTLE